MGRIRERREEMSERRVGKVPQDKIRTSSPSPAASLICPTKPGSAHFLLRQVRCFPLACRTGQSLWDVLSKCKLVLGDFGRMQQ